MKLSGLTLTEYGTIKELDEVLEGGEYVEKIDINPDTLREIKNLLKGEGELNILDPVWGNIIKICPNSDLGELEILIERRT